MRCGNTLTVAQFPCVRARALTREVQKIKKTHTRTAFLEPNVCCVFVPVRSSILLSYKLYTNARPGGQADWCADCPRAEALNIRVSRAITRARARAYVRFRECVSMYVSTEYTYIQYDLVVHTREMHLYEFSGINIGEHVLAPRAHSERAEFCAHKHAYSHSHTHS